MKDVYIPSGDFRDAAGQECALKEGFVEQVMPGNLQPHNNLYMHQSSKVSETGLIYFWKFNINLNTSF